MYREQVIQLEDELSRIREEGDVTREIFKVSSHLNGTLVYRGPYVKFTIFMRKSVFRVFDQVRHKSGCATIETSLRLVILDLEFWEVSLAS